MRCEQARQLFDAYLDGDLSTALATELGAHRLRCANCRRELALLEVAGHVLRTDAEPELSEEFADRLLRCVEQSPGWRWRRVRRLVYVAVPAAAAAVVFLAFLGVFDGRRESKVAGMQEVNPAAAPAKAPAQPTPSPSPSPSGVAFEEWLRQTEENLESGKRTGESLQDVLDSTFSNMLRLLEEPAEPATRAVGPPHHKPADKKDGIENM